MSDPGQSLQDTVHLAIETTGRLGSIAVLWGQRVLQQSNLTPSQRTAATLAPQLEQTLRWCHSSGHRLGFITVADGPGSFTGLRIGVTTAKSLSYALRLPLLSVDSLASIAAAAMHNRDEVQSLAVVLDAYRGQVFAGQFARASLLPELDAVPADWSGHPASVGIFNADLWQRRMAELAEQVAFAGDAKPLGPHAEARLPRTCDAVGTGLLGIRAATIGKFIDPMQLVPRYLRPSAAEEKAAKKSGK